MPTAKEKLQFSTKTSTKIWRENASPANPFLAESARLHGYDLFELMKNKSFVDVLYLMFSGELPTPEQSSLLECLMISNINPGPRHAATRASMTAAISKTRPAHILPIGLMVIGGEHLGAAEVEASMRFLKQHLDQDPLDTAKTCMAAIEKDAEGDRRAAPGFGTRFGGIDPMPNQLAQHLSEISSNKALAWAQSFVAELSSEGIGWLTPGVTAAVLLDLAIEPREGAGLFQLMSAPGLLAHGMEQTHRPFTDMPYVEDKDYVIE